jgi:hypothetical protein
MDSWYSTDKWLPSVDRFLQSWRVVRICPERIVAPKEAISFNILTLAISLAIFLMARISVAGSDTDIGIVLVAMVVSVAIVFVTGYVTLILQPGEQGIENAPKWGAFFIMTWLTSLLLLLLIDAIPFWLGYTRTTTGIIDAVFGPGNIAGGVKDLLRAIFFGTLAVGILLLKTKRMDTRFRVFERCALVTAGVGLLMNTALMAAFIYGHLI